MNEHDLRALDGELAQLVSVEPSPEFIAKVRAYIHQSPAADHNWWVWVLTSLAAAAALAAAIVTIMPPKAPVVQQSVAAYPDVRLPVEGWTGPGSLPRRPKVGQSVGHRRRSQVREPEFLIDPSLARAVRRLAINQPVLPDLPPEPSLDPIVIGPLSVPKIPDSTTKEGERQ